MHRRQPDPAVCADVTQWRPSLLSKESRAACVASVPRVDLEISEPPLEVDVPSPGHIRYGAFAATWIHPKHEPPEHVLQGIPAEVMAACFEYLPATVSLVEVRRTCRAWDHVVRTSATFRPHFSLSGMHLLGGVGHTTSPVVNVGSDRGGSCQPVSLTHGSKDWVPRLPPLRTNRLHCAAAVLDRRIYVVGGRAQQARLRSVEMYDPTMNEWSDISGMLCVRSGGAAIGHAGKLWVFGGTDGANEVSVVSVYDPIRREWDEELVPEMPHAASELCAVAFRGFILVIGGRRRDQVTLGCVRALNISSLTWEEWPSLETPRACPAVGVVGTTVWVAGGSDGNRSPLASTECLDTVARHSWLSGPPLSGPRSNPTGAVIRDRFHVLGGFYFGPLATVESLDPKSARWRRHNDMCRKFDAARAVVWE